MMRQCQLNAVDTTVKRAGYAGNLFVGFSGHPVKGDIEHERRLLRQEFNNGWRKQGTIAEQRDEKSFFLGIAVNIKKIGAHQWLATGNAKPQAAFSSELIEDITNLLIGKIVTERGVSDITMDTPQVTAGSDINHPHDRNSVFSALVVELFAEFCIFNLRNVVAAHFHLPRLLDGTMVTASIC